MKIKKIITTLCLLLGVVCFAHAQSSVDYTVKDRYFTTSDGVRLHYRVSGSAYHW
jgi:hypothetical protein